MIEFTQLDQQTQDVGNKILKFISKMKYRDRPKRTYPRISYKPRKNWGVGRDLITSRA